MNCMSVRLRLSRLSEITKSSIYFSYLLHNNNYCCKIVAFETVFNSIKNTYVRQTMNLFYFFCYINKRGKSNLQLLFLNFLHVTPDTEGCEHYRRNCNCDNCHGNPSDFQSRRNIGISHVKSVEL